MRSSGQAKNAHHFDIAAETKIEAANLIACDLGSSQQFQPHGSIAQNSRFQESGATRDSLGLVRLPLANLLGPFRAAAHALMAFPPRHCYSVTVHAGKGLAQFFGGKLTYFALRANAENLCLTLSNPGKRKYP